MDYRAREVRSGLRVHRDLLVHLVRKGRWDLLDRQVGHKGLLDHQDLRVCRDLLVTRETQELQDLKVSKGCQGLRVRRELPAHQEPQVPQALPVPWGLRVSLDHQEFRGLQGQRDQPG